MPFSVYLLTTFFRTVPHEIIESALADGASHLRILFQIVLPLSVPALVTLVVVNALWVWNELLIALVFLPERRAQDADGRRHGVPAPATTSTCPITMAGMLLASLPMVALYLVGQRYFIRGLIGRRGQGLTSRPPEVAMRRFDGQGRDRHRRRARHRPGHGAALRLRGRRRACSSAARPSRWTRPSRCDRGRGRQGLGAHRGRDARRPGRRAASRPRWSAGTASTCSINNAGIDDETPFLEMEEETWRAVVDTNLTAPFLLARRRRARDGNAGGGVILHNASIDASGGDGAVRQLQRLQGRPARPQPHDGARARELGIRVNCVSPGFTHTDMTERAVGPKMMEYLNGQLRARPDAAAREAQRDRRGVRLPGLGRRLRHHRHRPDASTAG